MDITTPDDSASAPGAAPVTGTEESDPNADSDVGLSGGMGVSSERLGPARGVEGEVTYGAAPTHPEEDSTAGEAPPEQSAGDDRPEVSPDSPGAHASDPADNPRHGV